MNLFAAVLAASVALGAPSKIEKSLEPKKAHEECITLSPPEELSYSFSSSSDVKFNLHYHVGKEVVYPVKRDKASSDKGTFKPASKQDYCLMWANGSEKPVTVKYEFEVKK